MEHLLFKAATTAATDQGTFTAVISTASVDREGDIIEPSAMLASLQKWVTIGKLVPLAWNHTDQVIGHIDPATAQIDNGEVVAKGWIDQGVDMGEEAWRLVKSGTLSFSFGFLFDPEKGATKIQGGRFRIKELDIFEISVVPIAPANNDTRVINWKSLPAEAADALQHKLDEVLARLETLEKSSQETAEETDEEPKVRSVDPLRKQAESVALEYASDGLSLRQPPRQVEQKRREPELSLRDLKQRMHDEILTHLSGEPTNE